MVRKKFLSKTKKQEELVVCHTSSAFAMLEEKRYSDIPLASRMGFILRQLSRKFRYCLPRHMKRSYCPRCKTVYTPGKATRVRVRRGKVIYFCSVCNSYTRYPYKPFRK